MNHRTALIFLLLVLIMISLMTSSGAPSVKLSNYYLFADILNTLARIHQVKGREVGEKQLIKGLMADLEYFGRGGVPEEFERFFPKGSKVPLVYLRWQGFNVHPTSAMNFATEALEYRNNWSEFYEIMDEMYSYLEEKNDALFFNFYFEWEKPGIPWNSSLCQGIAAGYYAIAYAKFKDCRFLRAAKGLVRSFLILQSEGGFKIITEWGPFYLEYSNAPDDLVLNGFMLSLKGLMIYNYLIKDKESELLVEQGLETLRRILPIYDTENWSLYSPKHGRATEIYHRLHVRLLYYLGRWYGDETLLRYAYKWNSYLGDDRGELRRAEQEYKFWKTLLENLKNNRN